MSVPCDRVREYPELSGQLETRLPSFPEIDSAFHQPDGESVAGSRIKDIVYPDFSISASRSARFIS